MLKNMINFVRFSHPWRLALGASLELDAWCLVLSLCLNLIPSANAQTNLSTQPGLLKSEFIYETAPFPECHASTIAESGDGLIAAWFGGTRERNPDVCIWSSRFAGGHWTAPVQLADGIQSPTNRLPCWNPVLFQPTNGPLLLFYKVGPSPSEWWGMMMTSADHGQTWSQPRRLPEGILGPIKNKPVQLSNGEILCPTSTEGKGGWRVHFERTSDFGLTWQATPPINDGHTIAAIQPSILIHADGKLQALGRTQQSRIFQTWSSDNGKTWQPMTLTDLPNPNSGTDAVALKDGRFLLVYNHNPAPKGRSPSTSPFPPTASIGRPPSSSKMKSARNSPIPPSFKAATASSTSPILGNVFASSTPSSIPRNFPSATSSTATGRNEPPVDEAPYTTQIIFYPRSTNPD